MPILFDERFNFTGTPSNILVSNDNVVTNTLPADTSTFSDISIDNSFEAPVEGYDTAFIAGSATSPEIQFIGNQPTDFKIHFSGSVTTTISDFNAYLVLTVTTDLGQVFTGGIKAYPFGVIIGGGVKPKLGFDLTVYGKIQPLEKVSLQIAANTAGDYTLPDCIVFVERIRPPM